MQFFQRISTSAWLARVDNLATMTEEEHLAHVGAYNAIPAADLRLVQAAADPRAGQPIAPPARAATPEETERQTVRALADKARARTATMGETQQLLGALAGRLGV
jgi:hypothetical protein